MEHSACFACSACQLYRVYADTRCGGITECGFLELRETAKKCEELLEKEWIKADISRDHITYECRGCGYRLGSQHILYSRNSTGRDLILEQLYKGLLKHERKCAKIPATFQY